MDYPSQGVAFENIEEELFAKTILAISDEKIAIIRNHHFFIQQYSPSFIAIGKDEFSGYAVYGFSKRNLFIMESYVDKNATYIFNDKWEVFSKLSKREILLEKLQKDRIYHTEIWEKRIADHFE